MGLASRYGQGAQEMQGSLHADSYALPQKLGYMSGQPSTHHVPLYYTPQPQQQQPQQHTQHYYQSAQQYAQQYTSNTSTTLSQPQQASQPAYQQNTQVYRVPCALVAFMCICHPFKSSTAYDVVYKKLQRHHYRLRWSFVSRLRILHELTSLV